MMNLIGDLQRNFDKINTRSRRFKWSGRTGTDLCPYKQSLNNNGSTAKDLGEKQRNACKICDGRRGACKYFM